jgi:hypothetical protein
MVSPASAFPGLVVQVETGGMLVHGGSKTARPLVILFGSYRGKGKARLEELSRRLRQKQINAYTVEEHKKLEEHKTPLEASLECADECDIAVFVFFLGESIGETENLESFDQGPIIEFSYICLVKTDRRTAVQLVFETEERLRHTSRLLQQLLTRATHLGEFIAYPEIRGESSDERFQEIIDAVLTFCINEYASRGVG